MSIPKQSEICRLLLEFLAEHPDRDLNTKKEVLPEMARRMGLSEADKAQTYSQSGGIVYVSRLRQAMRCLRKAGLTGDYIKPLGYWRRITKDGIAYLKQHPGACLLYTSDAADE